MTMTICGSKLAPGLKCTVPLGHWERHRKTWQYGRFTIQLGWRGK